MSIENFLRENNIKVTKGRIRILEVLRACSNAVSVAEIYDKCTEEKVSLDLSTIYRTVELFNNRGIVDKYSLGDGKYKYIINKDKHKHILKCTICNKEVEIDCPMQQIEQFIMNKTGFLIEENELDIKLKGVCKDCIDKKVNK